MEYLTVARGKSRNTKDAGLLDSTAALAKIPTRRITGDVRVIFGKNLHKLMQARGISQSDLAKECFGTTEEKGFTVANGRDRISKYLNGKSFPSPETVVKMKAKLECSLDDLLPPAVRTALEGANTPILLVEMKVGSAMATVKMNASFPIKFVEELSALVAKHRGANAVHRGKKG